VCVCVCVFVSFRSLKGKRLELSTPNLVHIYSMPVARHALDRRTKGQKSRSHVAAVGCCGRCATTAAGVWEWDCTSYDCLGF